MTDWQPVRLLPVHPADKEPSAEDPYELVGFGYPADADADAEMARCFVEEFALVGWSADEIEHLFTSPNFQGPYGIWRRNGDEFVKRVIAGVFGSRHTGHEREGSR